ncbi:MAG: DEAD/DEAH box helicase [Thermoleophilia bacterium]|nr:DEAD/DEAH box helicase [Thermoleophilia bacterium]
MDVFHLRDQLVEDYREYVESFIRIKDERIRSTVEEAIDAGLLWPAPLVQLNPTFEAAETVDELVADGTLHPECGRIFRTGKGGCAPGVTGGYNGPGSATRPGSAHATGNSTAAAAPARPLRFHRHQVEAIRAARTGDNYVLTTGTGSGKSLAYIVPIVDHVLRRGSGRGVQAIVVYPMNALANSQLGELEKFLCEGFLCEGYPDGKGPVTFARYTGQENDEARLDAMANPPDIILTNYVMLELILTREREKNLIKAAQGLKFLVLDELHTYRGRQGSDVALLTRRVRDRLAAADLQVVGTSATLAGGGTLDEQRAEVARVATQIFGAPVAPQRVIGETLRRATPPRGGDDPDFVRQLKARVEEVARDGWPAAMTHAEFVGDPLASWVESTFGVEPDPESGRLVRAQPISIRGANGAATRLEALCGVPEEACAEAVENLLLGAYRCLNPDTGFPVFAFRLHQFVGRGRRSSRLPSPRTSGRSRCRARSSCPENVTGYSCPWCSAGNAARSTTRRWPRGRRPWAERSTPPGSSPTA